MNNNLLRQLVLFTKQTIKYFLLQLLVIQVVLAEPSSSQSMEDYQVTLNVKNQKLVEVLAALENQTDFVFAYNQQVVKDKSRISISNTSDLKTILQKLTEQVDFDFKRVNNNIYVTHINSRLKIDKDIEFEEDVISSRYEIKITGKVVDDKGEPLPGASVTVSGTTNGTVTDIDGNYIIAVPEGSTLIFSYIGFETLRVSVDNQNQINVTLKSDLSSLEEVVVVGYGTQQKRDITGAVGQVKGDEIRNLPVAGVDRALQGRAAGVVIAANSGAPGSGTTVRIRGNSSIYGNNEPLYVVDGIPLGENVGGMQQIVNPNDVESIEILKDASAAAIYGSRGANGVVLITTRKGTSGAPKVMFNSYYGVKNAWRKPQLANATEFARTHLLAHENGGTTPIPAIAAVAPETWGEGTDWWDIVNQTGSVQNHDFSIMGGTDRVTYSTSLAYFKDEGFIRTSEFDRITFRFNTEYKLSKRIKIGTNLSLIHNSQRGINENTGEGGGVIASVFQLDPISPVYKTPEQLQLEAELKG
jgi:TonB-dependent starch-binding outer membrane protein SusC